MTSHPRPRVADWELLLARVQAFGFAVRDDGFSLIEVERGGRVCTIDLVTTVRYNGNDPRDIWLLSLALEDHAQWDASATYFARRPGDEEVLPVTLSLGRCSTSEPALLRHGIVGRTEDTRLPNADALLDALPYLASPNTIGYHRARQRIIDCYERLRPRTWVDVGIFDLGIIAEYERHRVSANDVAHAAEGGIVGIERIIAVFGMPADAEWTQIQRASL